MRFRKKRLLTVLVIFVILFVSYKILEPELKGRDHPGSDVVEGQGPDDEKIIKLESIDQQHVEFIPHVGLVQKPEDEKPSPGKPIPLTGKDKLVAKFLQLYDVMWDTQLTDNAWQLADSWVTTRYIHKDHVPELGGVLQRLAKARIMAASVGYKGSQLKLSFKLSGGRRVSFKPKWYPRDYIVPGLPYDGRDRHNAEIAAYHLQRLLGYNRSPIVVGRTVDLVRDVLPVADQLLTSTFFTNGTNMCFYGKCLYCKSEADGVCAEGTTLEGALILWLPEAAKYRKWRSPWQRVYTDPEVNKARWEIDDQFCYLVRESQPYDNGPRLMDLMDAVVFDYLIGNADRHHYETFDNDDESIIIMFDSAKSFGQPFRDEFSILAPLYQCCQIRNQTYTRLLDLQHGVLSTVLRHILSRDPIAPLLYEPHYEALDRRLVGILTEVNRCVQKFGRHFVFIDDYYLPKPIS